MNKENTIPTKTLAELRAEKAQLDEEIRQAELDALRKKQQAVSDKIQGMSEEDKTRLLSLLEHGRSSCSDENPCNGWSRVKDGWRCQKCMLMEILRGEHGGAFDFKVNVEITRVET